jgi:hypothetical protein
MLPRVRFGFPMTNTTCASSHGVGGRAGKDRNSCARKQPVPCSREVRDRMVPYPLVLGAPPGCDRSVGPWAGRVGFSCLPSKTGDRKRGYGRAKIAFHWGAVLCHHVHLLRPVMADAMLHVEGRERRHEEMGVGRRMKRDRTTRLRSSRWLSPLTSLAVWLSACQSALSGILFSSFFSFLSFGS